MATVLDISDGNGTSNGAFTPSSESTSDGSAHPSLSRTGLLQPAPQVDLSSVRLTALPSPPTPFEAPSPPPTIGFTSACGTVRSGGRTYPVVGHCAYGPIVVVEREVKPEEPEEDPADECSRKIYHLNPSPIFGIGTRILHFHLLTLLYSTVRLSNTVRCPKLFIVQSYSYSTRIM